MRVVGCRLMVAGCRVKGAVHGNRHRLLTKHMERGWSAGPSSGTHDESWGGGVKARQGVQWE